MPLVKRKHDSLIKSVVLCAALFALIFLAGCLFTFNTNPKVDQNAFENTPPVKIAVLPFANKTKKPESNEIARTAFFNAFASMNYQDIEIGIIDETLGTLSQETDKNPLDIPPDIVASRLGADALIYGSVDEVSKFYAVIYAHQKVAVTIQMYDARKNAIIFSDSIEAFNRTISPADSILGLLTSIVQTLWHMRYIERIETYERLGNKMVENIPNITLPQLNRPNYIRKISVDIPSPTLKLGDQIVVTAEAAPNMKAVFDIGALRHDLSMTEEQPGFYRGVYQIRQGDKVEYAVIIVRVGKQSQFDQKMGIKNPFSIDAVSPHPPSIISIRTTKKSFYIFLALPEDRDFDHFIFYKSTNPSNGFEEIGQSSQPQFKDNDIIAGQTIHYRALAVDKLGNQSPCGPDFVFQAPPQSPARIEMDRISQNMTLYAYSSPYTIYKPLHVEKGATLTIEAGTEIYFKKNGSIHVEGTLLANGEEDYPIILNGEDGWGGIRINSQNSHTTNFSFVELENATTAIDLSGSTLNARNITIKKCQTGIHVSSTASLKIERSTFYKNQTAIHSDSRQIAIHDCNFIKNSILMNSGGEVTQQEENTIENFSHNLY